MTEPSYIPVLNIIDSKSPEAMFGICFWLFGAFAFMLLRYLYLPCII